MRKSEIVNTLMFDWESLSNDNINDLIEDLPAKLLRWLGENHPDNKTRKLFFKLSHLSIPESAVINKNFVVSDDYLGLLKIGERVAIAPNVSIICTSAPNNSRLKDNAWIKQNLIVEKPVTINDDAWIGANTVILPGVIIGKGCVIGAGSIVNKNTDAYATYAGVPAKKINVLPKN